MYAFICLFLPAVISVWVLESAKKISLSKKQWLYYFCLNTVLINLACCAAKKWVLRTGDYIITGLQTDMSPSTACNYLILSAVFTLATAFAEALLSKHVSLEVCDNEDCKEHSTHE